MNAPRLAKRLVREGELVPLAHGLFAHLKQSRFGVVPPSDDELMRAFLGGAPFVFTGPDRWNALGLGTTAVFAVPFVYNTKRSGTFHFGGRRFVLRRVAFPENPPPEWFVVDLLEHADQAGASRTEVTASLARALARGAFSRERLREMAKRYSTQATQAIVASTASASLISSMSLHFAGFEVWFKGGTSLSKGFGLIERFSEDLDLKIDPGNVGSLLKVSNWKSDGAKATGERRIFFEKLPGLISVPGARIAPDPNSIGGTWRSGTSLAASLTTVPRVCAAFILS